MGNVTILCQQNYENQTDRNMSEHRRIPEAWVLLETKKEEGDSRGTITSIRNRIKE